MGEAKRRRERGATPIDENITAYDTAEAALRRLGGVDAGTPMSVALVGAGLITQAAQSGALEAKLLAKEATTERHLYRLAFSMWDRIRTGEHNPWECTLCAKHYTGLAMLSVFALIDHPRSAPVETKPALMALVCQACDSVSMEETTRRINEMFGFYPAPQGQA
jgi:hypothetical protein